MSLSQNILKKIVRTSKADSAYVYAIFESHEWLANYSTLPHQEGDPYRDILLLIPYDCRDACEAVLTDLMIELNGVENDEKCRPHGQSIDRRIEVLGEALGN